MKKRRVFRRVILDKPMKVGFFKKITEAYVWSKDEAEAREKAGGTPTSFYVKKSHQVPFGAKVIR